MILNIAREFHMSTHKSWADADISRASLNLLCSEHRQNILSIHKKNIVLNARSLNRVIDIIDNIFMDGEL